MHPAFSVVFLTTLIGAAQGLFLALYTVQSYAAVELLPAQEPRFYVYGSLVALALLLQACLPEEPPGSRSSAPPPSGAPKVHPGELP